jgi:hypothetical protein
MENLNAVLLSTAYLPPVHYFSYLVKADQVFIEQFETFPRQTYRNRCEIMTANGKFSLSIPVEKPFGNHSKTGEIGIVNYQNWQTVHWRTIESAYANSPYFLYYKDQLLPFFQKKYHNLLQYNLELLMVLLEIMEIDKSVKLTTSFQKVPDRILDLRETITPKKPITNFNLRPYYQVFEDKYGFMPGLSILDLLFNVGEEAVEILLDN